MLSQHSSAVTLIATSCQDADKIAALEQAGAELMVLPSHAARVDLVALWKELGQRNLQSLLLEGGATLAAAALEHHLIDRMMVFIAAKMLGGTSQHGIFSGPGCPQMTQAIPLENSCVEQLGKDFLITGEVIQCLPD
jgi:diaminohydroxyphosphoribosylaminopyrimidine deaminase/5-amino-6-(5-phosphoribosylamino)uracil reductase